VAARAVRDGPGVARRGVTAILAGALVTACAPNSSSFSRAPRAAGQISP
jgi:hypothetical protein